MSRVVKQIFFIQVAQHIPEKRHESIAPEQTLDHFQPAEACDIGGLQKIWAGGSVGADRECHAVRNVGSRRPRVNADAASRAQRWAGHVRSFKVTVRLPIEMTSRRAFPSRWCWCNRRPRRHQPPERGTSATP